jgi:hypothetical protein
MKQKMQLYTLITDGTRDISCEPSNPVKAFYITSYVQRCQKGRDHYEDLYIYFTALFILYRIFSTFIYLRVNEGILSFASY